MPQLNHAGPESNGPKTGRKLGLCRNTNSVYEFGQGMGLKRRAVQGMGLGKRLRSTNIFNNNLK